MKQLSIKASCFLLLTLAFIASCTKDPVGKPQPGSGEQQTAKELRVALNESYLPLSKVDSALAIWTANGVTQSVRLQAVDGVLKTSLANFNYQGAGTLTVQLFTQLKVDGQPLQWEYSAYYQLYRTDPVLLTGPASITDPEWKPRVIFNYDNSMGSRFRAFIALRPGDPYFELKGVEPVNAKKIKIKRSFHDKASGQLVFSRGWVCERATCLDQTTWSMVDRYHFLNLDEQLAGRQWDQFRVEAYFHLNSTPASVIGFALVQDKIQ